MKLNIIWIILSPNLMDFNTCIEDSAVVGSEIFSTPLKTFLWSDRHFVILTFTWWQTCNCAIITMIYQLLTLLSSCVVLNRSLVLHHSVLLKFISGVFDFHRHAQHHQWYKIGIYASCRTKSIYHIWYTTVTWSFKNKKKIRKTSKKFGHL